MFDTMQSLEGSGILAGAALVSAVHGLLPNHWAPFVLMGRAQGWTQGKMLRVMVTASIAHTAVSGGIAMATLLLGVALAEFIEPVAHLLPAAILLVTGLVYIALDTMGHDHAHHHHHADVHQEARAGMSNRAATTTLVLTLALSPCEAMVPVFVSAAPLGDAVFLLAVAVLSGAATLAVMAVLAVMAWHGAKHVRFGWVAHHERLVVGGLLVAIGLATLAVVLTMGHD